MSEEMLIRSIRDMILETMIRFTSMKETALYMEIIRRLSPAVFSHEQFYDVLNKLISDGEILVLKYKSPGTPDPDRIKSIFFIKGTQFLSENKVVDVETSPLDRESKVNI